MQTLDHFKKLFPDTNFNTKIPDVSGKFRRYEPWYNIADSLIHW